MTTISSWNEAYDFGRAQGMSELEAAAYSDAHFANPDAVVEELHALTGVVEPPETQAGHRDSRREMYEGRRPTRLGMLPGYTKEKP